MKYLLILATLLVMSGCASTGDLEALQTRVDTLEAGQKSLVSEHEAIKAEHGALIADHNAIKLEHSRVSTKIDNLFKKIQLK